MSIYADRLKRMQGAMTEQMADYVPGGFLLLPEGEYQFRLQATLDETKKEPKRLMVTWQFTVADGDKIGKKVFDRTIIENNKVGAQICRGRIEDLGKEWPENFAEIENILEDITANPPLVVARVTHESYTGNDGKEYTNARIRIIDILESNNSNEVDSPEVDTSSATDISEESVDENQSALLALCGSYQLSYIDDSMDSTAIVAALKENGATFKEEDLQPEELTLIESLDSELIEKKKVVPARKVTAPAKFPNGKPKKK